MRILIITPYLPWPQDSGGNAAQFSTLKCLSLDHEFTVICPIQSLEQAKCAQELSIALPKIHLVPIPVGPIHNLNVNSRMSCTVIALKMGLKCVGARCLNAARVLDKTIQRFASNDYNSIDNTNPQHVPYNPFRVLPEELIESVKKYLQPAPDLIQVEFCEMLSLSSWLPREIPKVFVHHQLHWIYSQRILDGCSSTFHYGRYLSDYMKAQELSLLQKFNSVIAFSEQDMGLIKQNIPNLDVIVSPFPVPDDVGFSDSFTPFRNTFSFIGSEAHFPNILALQRLVTDIFPRIEAKLPGAKLHIIGKWSNELQRRYRKENIQFLGFIKDLGAAIRGSILCVPLTIGSGIRTKILVAMAQRVPVISTTIGAEGLICEAGTHFVQADSDLDFAEAGIKLACDRRYFSSIANSGHDVVRRHYSPQSVQLCRNALYDRVVVN